MAEMLLQSHTGSIELLPALPDAWKNGSVQGLKARGGYEVNIAWKDGILMQAEILSDRARDCAIKYKNNIQSFSIKANEKLIINKEFKILE